MPLMSRIGAAFSVSAEHPAMMRSQLQALRKQLPLLYLILGSNVLSLAYTHYGKAPDILSLYAPALLLPLCVQRSLVWIGLDVANLSVEQIRARLRSTVALVCVIGSCFTAWSLALIPYGDAYARVHVAFFMSITVIGCIFCMMHLRPAALLLTVIVTVPFMLCFLTTGNTVLIAISVNFCLVSTIMIVILITYYRDFRHLVHSQLHLAALSDENLRMAHVDSLTGLANRRSFFTDVQELIDEQAREGGSFTLGLIDLDGFKPVNDIYGHSAGDHVLAEVGSRLVQTMGDGVRLARLGGDEFSVMLPRVSDVSAIRGAGRAICQALQASIALPTGHAQVAASVGFATFPEMAQTREQLIERADYALYHAKEHSRGTAVIFTKDHEKAIRARSLVEQELRHADLEQEISLQYQPLFDVACGRTSAFEALARWTSPALGPVSPAEFIVAAERIGLINTLSEMLLNKACAAMRSWPVDIGLSFNLSVHDIASEAAVTRLAAIIVASGIEPHRIALEITETALMRDYDQAKDALLVLKATGAEIVLDDFGTGYSSLSYVHRLPLDKLKIDRSFTAELGSGHRGRDIVKSIVDLCRNLGLTCIAEGVETPEQVGMLTALGCTTMQGYHFSRPINAEAVAPFLRAEAALDADVRMKLNVSPAPMPLMMMEDSVQYLQTGG